MGRIEGEKADAARWIDDHWSEATALADRIWGYAEPGLREYRSARAHCEFLARHGFTVETETAGMPTAFVATYGSGVPVIATSAEYDATPGQSQQAVPHRAPRVPYGPGFTDAHHWLGTAASAGATAVAATLREREIPGTVKVFGTPAEKLYVGKAYMAKAGAFEGVDAFCTWHPGFTNKNYNSTLLEVTPGSAHLVLYTFVCDEPWTWSQPGGLAGVRHPGALEGMQVMYHTAKSLRDHMLPRTGGWMVAEFIMTGGQTTTDNWPADIAQILYEFHAPELLMQQTIMGILDNCAEGAAKITYTKVHRRIVSMTRPGLPSVSLGRLMYRNLELVGPPRFSEQEKAFANELLRNFGLQPLAEPFNEGLTPPEELEREDRRFMTPEQRHRGTDDSTELSWHAPMGALMVCGNALNPSPGVVYPIWFEAALSGTTAVHKTGLVAAKTIALSMVELFTRPEALREAQEEFRRRRAVENVDPLLPADLPPPIDLRWPEWVDNRYPMDPSGDVRWVVPIARLDS